MFFCYFARVFLYISFAAEIQLASGNPPAFRCEPEARKTTTDITYIIDSY